MNQGDKLLQGIVEQTESEIARINEEGARLERDRTAKANGEIERIRREIEERTANQRLRIEKKAKASVSTECHKIELEARERFFSKVLEAASRRLRALIDSESYKSTLRDWIVEGAIGLAADEAIVCSSPKEMELCRQVLPEAEERVRELTGQEFKLRLADSPLSHAQGVVLTSLSGRTAYNNQVRTRMMRRQSEVRRIIYEELARSRQHIAAESGHEGENRRDDG